MEAPIGKALPPSHLADATIAGIAVPPRATSIGDASPPPATAILPNFDDLEILNHPGHVDFYFMNTHTSRFRHLTFTSVYLKPTNMGFIILCALLQQGCIQWVHLHASS